MDVPDLTDTTMPESSTAIRFFRDGAWITGGKAVMMTASLILNSVVARLLSLHDVGVYFIILSIVPFGMVLGNVGLKDANVKVTAERFGWGHPGRARSAIHTAFLSAAIGSLFLAAAFVLLTGPWISSYVFKVANPMDMAILVWALGMLLTASTQLAETFRGFHDIRLATITNGLANNMMPAVGVLGLWIVAVILRPSDVALFGAASRLVMIVATPLILANAVVAPMIAELCAKGKREELERLLRSVAALAAVLCLLFLSLFSAFARPILGRVFGGFYDSAWAVLLILSVGQTINAITSPCALTPMMTGNQTGLMGISFVSTVLPAGLGLGLGFAYGPEGSATLSAAGGKR
jgi:O-antigen/teichoic acid export membrane protein